MCLMLCSNAAGVDSGSLVRKTAVPGTETGACSLLRSIDFTNDSKRNVGVACLVMQELGAALPGPHDDHDGDSDQHRHIAAIVDLQQVGAEEDHFQRRRAAAGSTATVRDSGQFQRGTHELESKQRIDDHRAGDRDAVGGCERFGRAEDEDQQHDAEHQKQR